MHPTAPDSYPPVPDFVVRVSDDAERTIEFASLSRGKLAGFPVWEHADRDLRHFVPSDVPIGTAEEPYEDRDEAWRIRILEDAGFVYVEEWDSPEKEDAARRFRVPTIRYLQAWAALIDMHNPIMPFDEA